MPFTPKPPPDPPRLILADAGNVRVVYKTAYRAETIACWLSLDVEAVTALIHRSHAFHQLERGECSWEHYVSFVETAVQKRIAAPALWSRERFAEIWVEALTEPIAPVLDLLEALARHVPVVSASNADVLSYRDGVARDPRVTAMLAVHSDSFVIGRRKGDPDYFETLLSYVNAALDTDVRPEECVFIDDRVEFVTAAISAGMRALWFADRMPEDVRVLRHELVQRGGVPEAWLP